VSKITESARGEQCQIRIPGVCTGNPESTVWAHANGSAAGKGIGMKSPDILGSYACQACHDEYDRRNRKSFRFGHRREDVELWFWQGHARSICILLDKGLLVTERGKVKIAA
jgi:hypothetical protein